MPEKVRSYFMNYINIKVQKLSSKDSLFTKYITIYLAITLYEEIFEHNFLMKIMLSAYIVNIKDYMQHEVSSEQNNQAFAKLVDYLWQILLFVNTHKI